jgi:hypothetical protein
VPEPTEQPAKPAAAPAVKSYRGKVKFTEPEPTAPTDVLTELADEDEIDLEDPLELLAGN